MSGHENKRAVRVAQLIQQELARLLIEGVKDPRIGLVTVTEVRLTDDLRSASVYASAFGVEAVRERTLTGLNAAAGFLRRELAQRLALRFMPELSFVLDDSLDRAERLEQLLGAAASGAHDVPPPRGTAALAALPAASTGREMPPPPPLPAVPPAPRAAARRRRRPQRGTGR